jgi:hypothetical protein
MMSIPNSHAMVLGLQNNFLLFVREVLMSGDTNIILGAVGCPIENRFSGVGRPDDIVRHNRPLNNRQQRLLDSLFGYDSRVTVRKSDVSMIDLAALTAKEGVEFAMFTRGPERLIVRGNERHVNINPLDAAVLKARGYKWSGHTHIGSNLNESPGDKDVLWQFTQRRSVIYNAMGKRKIFVP